METVIRVQNLGKKYFLRHQMGSDRRYVALRDVMVDSVKSIFRPRQKMKRTREEFWALRGIDFEIKKGQAVGIIGRNGAGKSTLLKLLSRIVRPTEGRIEINGRVASLLEVGTGFHPELSGRENVFLNGALMGMGRAEIKRKFDEIVDFAQVEKFIDTPVKHFSSGMYVRLAFAVAAHLEPEILIVDEVLAVGDIQFQRKCLAKMEDVSSKQGRTILFVSHNMDLVMKLCQTALLLNAGKIGSFGDVHEIAKGYLDSANSLAAGFKADSETRILQSVSIDQKALAQERLIVRIGFKYPDKVVNPIFSIVIYTEGGSPITTSNTRYHPLPPGPTDFREGIAVVTFDYMPLWSERYTISVWISDGPAVLDWGENVLTFDFVSMSTPPRDQPTQVQGPVYLKSNWNLEL